jgi:hypothetical protein
MKINKEEREKENLIDEIERALHAFEKPYTNACPLPAKTPEEIQSQKELCKIISKQIITI